MWDRRVWRNIDFTLIGVMLAIMVYGLAVIASATRSFYPAGGDGLHFVKQQALWIVLALAVMVLTVTVDYSSFPRLAGVLYLANLAMLGTVLFLGRTALGAQRWIQLGPFGFQPSEFAKLMIIITLASYLARRDENWGFGRFFVLPFLHVLLPMALIVKQPDLGTAMVFFFVLFGMLLVAGAPLRLLVLVFGGGLALGVFAIYLNINYGLPLPLKDYQIKRLIVFVNPQVDPLGTGYHIRQSLIAVGSGRILGKGLFAGAQNQLNFLPEQHTDFIFSVVGEELGFVGATVLLLLYLVLFWRGIRIASRARDLLGTLLAGGIVSMLLFHVLINTGMTVGVMPITGIPLPFMSYGGSSMIANAMGVGLLLGIYLRRHKIQF